MCDFCDYIFDYQLLYGRFSNKEKLAEQEKEREKFKTKTGFDYNYMARNVIRDYISIVAVTGDPFCEGSVDDIKYCPYCGKKLE